MDDIVFGFTVNDKLTEFVVQMKNEFEMSMVDELNYFLGLQVKKSNDGIFISQSKYAKNLVKKFGLDLAKHMKTLVGTYDKLSKDENSVSIYPTLFRSMIGSLLYLIASGLDICFSVGICATYQVNPKELHIAIMRRIIRIQ